MLPLTYVLLSGGMDSAACAAHYIDLACPVRGLFVDFGQAACRKESASAEAVAAHYGFPLDRAVFHGSRAFGAGEVRGRNGFLLLTALMLLPSDIGVIAMGIHAGTPYYDCSAGFMREIGALYDGYTDGRVRIDAPFVAWDKPTIWHYCISHGVPVQLTYSCEAGTDPPCGQCLSCRDRSALDAGTA